MLGVPRDGLAFQPQSLPCFRKWDNLWPAGPLGLYADFTLPFFVTKWIQGTLCNFIFSAGLNCSSIVGNNLTFLTWLHKWLKPVTSQSSYWNRCYQATVNGWSSSVFHSNCDEKGPSVTIIRVGEHIFGGYTKHSWGK